MISALLCASQEKLMIQLSDDEIREMTTKNEDVAKLQFEARDYSVTKLDERSQRKRPDFLLEGHNRRILVEVKTILSAGRTVASKHQPCGIALSRYDPATRNRAIWFSDDDPIRKLAGILENANQKYHALVKDDPSYEQTPYVVCIFDEAAFCPTVQILQDGFFGCNTVQAVLRPVIDRLLYERVRALPDTECESSLAGKIDLGPPSFEWLVIRNRAANIPADPEFFSPYILDQD